MMGADKARNSGTHFRMNMAFGSWWRPVYRIVGPNGVDPRHARLHLKLRVVMPGS